MVSALGLFEPFLTYILVLVGLTFARATDAALLQSLKSIFIVIIASLLFKEKISKFFIVLSFVIIIGLYFSIGSSLSELIHNGMTGNLLIISGMLAAAVYVVLTSHSIAVANSINIVAFQQVTALLATTLAFFVEYIATDYTFSIPSIGIVLLAIVSGILQYALAFTFYLISYKKYQCRIGWYVS